MSKGELCRQLRALTERAVDAPAPSDVLNLADAFVLECSSTTEPEVLLYNLEDELQTIYRDTVGHVSQDQIEIFVTLLYHLHPVLSSTSIISTWWDLVLRPALRERQLDANAVDHAKQLVLTALQKVDENSPEKVGEFRRRLMDLYLLDAINETDVLEFAELDREQRERQTRWKANLTEILVNFGLARPHDLSTELYHCFASAKSRLQLLILLNSFTAHPSFPDDAACTVACHPLMSSLLRSLQIDNSSTVCTIGLTVLVKLLPIFAVKASKDLKRLLPGTFAILARLLCWTTRASLRLLDTPALGLSVPDEDISALVEIQIDEVPLNETLLEHLALRPDLEWERLESIFSRSSTSTPSPSPHLLFTYLYYLFPCNVVGFLRSPARYLLENGLDSPYVVDWQEALDEDQIRTKCEILLRGHVTHPAIVWHDAPTELAQPDTWANHSISQIIGESTMLDVRNAALAVTQDANPRQHLLPVGIHDEYSNTPRVASLGLVSPAPEKFRISLQDMIATSVALKSNQPIEIVNSTPTWSTILSARPSGSPSEDTISLPDVSALSSMQAETEKSPSHANEVLSLLQKEVLLLRNELNFELWLKRENIKHVGRLYQGRILMRGAEVERQGLHNKLRDYRKQVSILQEKLKGNKQEAQSAKTKYADWNHDLQTKLKDLKDQKKSWNAEAASLRRTDKESKAQSVAQGKWLAAATKKVVELETTIKETSPKVARLRDYETRIDQLTTMQRLWDEDVRRYNEQAEDLKEIMSKYRKMKLRLESHEQTQSEMEEAARESRQQILSLEARISSFQNCNGASADTLASQMAAVAAQSLGATKAIVKLRMENARLRDEMEEKNAKIEVLKGQIGQKESAFSSAGEAEEET